MRLQLFDFGNITLGTSVDKVFTITHRGINPATSISAVSLSAPFAYILCSFPGTGGTCGPDMTIGDTCTIAARYTPTGRVESSEELSNRLF